MVGQEADEQAVRGIVKALVAAWNRHDARAFAVVFAEDADFTNVFGMHAKGRAEIEGFHLPIFKTMFKDSRLEAVETRIRFLRPDVAAADVLWKMTGAHDANGKEWPDRRGLLNFVATAKGGAWSIDVFHNMDLPEAERAQAQAALMKR
ncbi:MAG: SgcJ/EcaC family oxidoreductase [Pseudomonadota bacterium]